MACGSKGNAEGSCGLSLPCACVDLDVSFKRFFRNISSVIRFGHLSNYILIPYPSQLPLLAKAYSRAEANPPHPNINAEAVAHEAVVIYREGATTKAL